MSSFQPPVVEQPKADFKPKRERSVGYPSFTIESCEKLTQQIKEFFSDVQFVDDKTISKAVGVSGGSFLMKLSSAVKYGLLDLKQGSGYKPSALYKKISQPLPNENPNDARIECFTNPELYKKLVEEWNNKELPNEVGMANILDRNYGVKGAAAKVAVKIFFKNATTLGLISDNNILRVGSYLPFVEPETVEVLMQPPELIQLPSNVKTEANSSQIKSTKIEDDEVEIPVYFINKKTTARVLMPKDFGNDELKKVIKVLSGYLEE